ncbi:hypothetical protein SERLADRAFT_410612 [Serpula lacrymans var. lacrymans S7.9]|uniref:DUF6533 domain-containing protein n=1 Tax=Serpula lacrymans var. lacrymans (strain S7.9) TaxID=578457 RepID=F8P6P4_SERL9|nr:uncharacterized protein SERLADRAFT_410612 [Serpula lacrymans var. lacrymans S7.9]EGO21110.1 hypothetical protein SERLADRAFT_410612 [Serpula lacrymans var. lacrymans S7.9]
MDVSADSSTIAAAKSLQLVNYAVVATVAVMVYDYCILLGDEIMYISTARRKKAKAMHLIARWLPFSMLGVRCYGLQALSLFIAELIFTLRTYALWGHSKRCWAIVVGIVVLMTIDQGPSICLPLVSIAYALLIVYEVEILLFSLYRALIHYRSTRSPLLRVLLQHNIFYFSCGLVIFFGAWHLLSRRSIPYYTSLQVVIHAILVTRMQIDLWKSDQLTHQGHVRYFEGGDAGAGADADVDANIDAGGERWWQRRGRGGVGQQGGWAWRWRSEGREVETAIPLGTLEELEFARGSRATGSGFIREELEQLGDYERNLTRAIMIKKPHVSNLHGLQMLASTLEAPWTQATIRLIFYLWSTCIARASGQLTEFERAAAQKEAAKESVGSKVFIDLTNDINDLDPTTAAAFSRRTISL